MRDSWSSCNRYICRCAARRPSRSSLSQRVLQQRVNLRRRLGHEREAIDMVRQPRGRDDGLARARPAGDDDAFHGRTSYMNGGRPRLRRMMVICPACMIACNAAKPANSPGVSNIGCGFSSGLSSWSGAARSTVSISGRDAGRTAASASLRRRTRSPAGEPSSRLKRFSNPSGSAGRSLAPSRRQRTPLGHDQMTDRPRDAIRLGGGTMQKLRRREIGGVTLKELLRCGQAVNDGVI